MPRAKTVFVTGLAPKTAVAVAVIVKIMASEKSNSNN
jgi:hypothetical protein